MYADIIGFKAARQLRSNSLDMFSCMFKEFEKMFRKCSFHIFFCGVTTKNPWRLSRRDCLNSSMPIFVISLDSFKFLQHSFKTMNIMRMSRKQEILYNYAES